MSEALTKTEPQPPTVPMDVSIGAMIEAFAGDIGKLPPDQKLRYLAATCESVGLNPLTKPFDLIQFQGKTVMFANKGCAEQLRKIHGVSVEIVERKVEFGCLIVRVKATDAKGRHDEALAAVPFNERAVAEAANAMMKCETKAKRRVTLSICGLGMLDESEVETLRETRPVEVITGQPSAHDFARRLNEGMTAGEKDKAIEVASPEPESENEFESLRTATIKPEPVAPAVTSPPAQPPVTPPAPVAPIDYSLLSEDDKLRAFEAVLARNPACLDWLLNQSKLKKGADLSTIDAAFREKVAKSPDKFIAAVEKWAKGRP